MSTMIDELLQLSAPVEASEGMVIRPNEVFVSVDELTEEIDIRQHPC